MSETKQRSAVQTTGHAWDGDLQEFNNPLPRWWLWSFYATAVFSLIYWFIYPSWPVGRGWLEGTATVTLRSRRTRERVAMEHPRQVVA
ncbi:MAG: cbb3-type cytochrome c oxidase N-terminal domain-containing protein [Candidatus Competibacteraceae bacterium]